MLHSLGHIASGQTSSAPNGDHTDQWTKDDKPIPSLRARYGHVWVYFSRVFYHVMKNPTNDKAWTKTISDALKSANNADFNKLVNGQFTGTPKDNYNAKKLAAGETVVPYVPSSNSSSSKPTYGPTR